MNVLNHSHSPRKGPTYTLSWLFAPGLIAFVILRLLTGSLVVGILGGIALSVGTALLRRVQAPKWLPEAKDFTPPYGTPVLNSDRPHYGMPARKKGAPATHAPTATKDVGTQQKQKQNQAFDNLGYDPVGQLVHGLRSGGFATLRSKPPAQDRVSVETKPGKTEVFIRDDSDTMNLGPDATEATTSVDSLMGYLSTSVKDIGYSQAGWTVVANQHSNSSGRWTATLRSNAGNTVTLNLVDPQTFTAAVRGTNREQQMSHSHGISRELRSASSSYGK